MITVARGRRSAGLVLLLLLLAVASSRAALAGGGGPCQYASDPANSQARGLQVTVTGTFGEQHQNGVIQVRLRSGANVYALNPNGVADGSGAFDHTVTIPVGTPIGDYDLITIGPGPPDNPVFCLKPFSVTQGGGGFTTATTTTLAPTTTTMAPTTTTTTTTTPETTTTTLSDETSTTVDDLVASDAAASSGVPLWLLIAFVLALVVAMVGYFRGRQPKT